MTARERLENFKPLGLDKDGFLELSLIIGNIEVDMFVRAFSDKCPTVFLDLFSKESPALKLKAIVWWYSCFAPYLESRRSSNQKSESCHNPLPNTDVRSMESACCKPVFDPAFVPQLCCFDILSIPFQSKILVLGPRQSGKSSMIAELLGKSSLSYDKFKDGIYYSFPFAGEQTIFQEIIVSYHSKNLEHNDRPSSYDTNSNSLIVIDEIYSEGHSKKLSGYLNAPEKPTTIVASQTLDRIPREYIQQFDYIFLMSKNTQLWNIEPTARGFLKKTSFNEQELEVALKRSNLNDQCLVFVRKDETFKIKTHPRPPTATKIPFPPQ